MGFDSEIIKTRLLRVCMSQGQFLNPLPQLSASILAKFGRMTPIMIATMLSSIRDEPSNALATLPKVIVVGVILFQMHLIGRVTSG